MKLIYILLLVSCLITSCNNNSNTIEANALDVPEDFSAFYTSFHTDSAFQMDHIIFPLAGHPAADTGQVYNNNFKWEKENWKMHNFDHFDPAQFEVSRHVTDSTLITETIRDKVNGFGIKRRFAKFDDQWYLIYYDAMNPAK